MKKIIVLLLASLYMSVAGAEETATNLPVPIVKDPEGVGAVTMRVPQVSNSEVAVWKTTIAPGLGQGLTMHRHEHDRVLVPLTDGVLEVVDQHNKKHMIFLSRGQALFLPKDEPNMMHTDRNITKHVITVIVVELLK